MQSTTAPTFYPFEPQSQNFIFTPIDCTSWSCPSSATDNNAIPLQDPFCDMSFLFDATMPIMCDSQQMQLAPPPQPLQLQEQQQMLQQQQPLIPQPQQLPPPITTQFNSMPLISPETATSSLPSTPSGTVSEEWLFINNSSSSQDAKAPRGRKRAVSDTTGNSNNKKPSMQYQCQHPGCGKSFSRSYNLTSHMRTHTLERPYACRHCGRRFARQHDRNRHEKLHWQIKPYVCHNCTKPFARLDALNRHLRVQNGCGSVMLAAAALAAFYHPYL